MTIQFATIQWKTAVAQAIQSNEGWEAFRELMSARNYSVVSPDYAGMLDRLAGIIAAYGVEFEVKT